jgi:hypothetical protein
MSATWIEYKGKKILYIDYRGLKGHQLVENIELVAKIEAESPTQVLSLLNVEGIFATQEYMERSRQLGKEVLARKTKKSAIVGITGVKAVLLDAYNTLTGGYMRPFKTEDEAKEWLILDDK